MGFRTDLFAGNGCKSNFFFKQTPRCAKNLDTICGSAWIKSWKEASEKSYFQPPEVLVNLEGPEWGGVAQTQAGPLAPSSGARKNYKHTRSPALENFRQFLSEPEFPLLSLFAIKYTSQGWKWNKKHILKKSKKVKNIDITLVDNKLLIIDLIY